MLFTDKIQVNLDNNNVNKKLLIMSNILNVFNVKTKFQINYCHNENLYDFTILNSSNNEILFNNKYKNIIEVNKIIQQYK